MAPAVTLYESAVVPIIRTLKNLSRVLKKAEEYANEKGIPHSELIEARLISDMHPLPFQIQTASNTAKFLMVRVAGVANEPWDDNEKTFDELQARITKTINFLEAVKPAQLEGKEESEVDFHGTKYTGLSYTTEFALPNFYFHAVTAYNILRMKGVNIGKKDWLGW